ncbi:hypothetical protein D9M71_631410 [compost metagenome]
MTEVVSVLTVIVAISRTIQGQCWLSMTWRLFRGIAVAVWLVVRCTTVTAGGHRAVALIAVDRATWRVDWQLLVVGANAIAVRVGVGEYTALQHAVR